MCDTSAVVLAGGKGYNEKGRPGPVLYIRQSSLQSFDLCVNKRLCFRGLLYLWCIYVFWFPRVVSVFKINHFRKKI